MINYLVRKLLRRTLNCEQVSSFLVDYIDDSLPPKVKAQFEDHIEMCATCHALLEQYRTTVDLVQEFGEPIPAPPSELAQATLDFLNQRLPTLPEQDTAS